jgi:hypothetical protein
VGSNLFFFNYSDKKMLEKYDHFSYFNSYLYARGGNGVVSQSALLKGGYGTRQGGKQLARSSRRSSGMRSSLMQDELVKYLHLL